MTGQKFAAVFVVDDYAPPQKIDWRKQAAEQRLGGQLVEFLREHPWCAVEMQDWTEKKEMFMSIPQRQFMLRVRVYPERGL